MALKAVLRITTEPNTYTSGAGKSPMQAMWPSSLVLDYKSMYTTSCTKKKAVNLRTYKHTSTRLDAAMRKLADQTCPADMSKSCDNTLDAKVKR